MKQTSKMLIRREFLHLSHLPQPCSMYFFALSHAPPAVFKNIANLGASKVPPSSLFLQVVVYSYSWTLSNWAAFKTFVTSNFTGLVFRDPYSGWSKSPCNWVVKSPSIRFWTLFNWHYHSTSLRCWCGNWVPNQIPKRTCSLQPYSGSLKPWFWWGLDMTNSNENPSFPGIKWVGFNCFFSFAQGFFFHGNSYKYYIIFFSWDLIPTDPVQ